MRPLSRLWLIQVSGISAQDYLARSDKTPVHSIITVSRDSGTLIVGCRRRVLVASSIHFYLKNHHKFLQFHRHHVLTLPTLTCIEHFPDEPTSQHNVLETQRLSHHQSIADRHLDGSASRNYSRPNNIDCRSLPIRLMLFKSLHCHPDRFPLPSNDVCL